MRAKFLVGCAGLVLIFCSLPMMCCGYAQDREEVQQIAFIDDEELQPSSTDDTPSRQQQKDNKEQNSRLEEIVPEDQEAQLLARDRQREEYSTQSDRRDVALAEEEKQPAMTSTEEETKSETKKETTQDTSTKAAETGQSAGAGATTKTQGSATTAQETATAAQETTTSAPVTTTSTQETATSTQQTGEIKKETKQETKQETKKEESASTKASSAQKIDREKKLTIHFPNTDIRLALETISTKVGVGIIAGPDVQGRISIKLEDVPWEKGLDILLKTYGFSYVWEEGLIRVMSRKTLQEMEMQTQIFKVEHADPLEVEKAVRVVLSPGGACQASKETKTLIIKDNPENLKNIQALIERLERMAKQGREQKEGVGEEETAPAAAPKGEAKKKKSLALDFKEVPIRDAVAQISALSGVFISVGEEVKSVVTLSTAGKEVPWQKALKEIIAASDLAYEPADLSVDNLKPGDFIRLRSKEKILEKFSADEKIAERVEVEHVVVQLKYVDAADIQKILETQLTARGKITILPTTGQAGWKFASDKAGSTLQVQERAETKPAKSRTILLSDIPASVRKMLKIIDAIDIMPYQIIIESKFIEVSKDFLRDHGFDIASNTTGLTDATITQLPLIRKFYGPVEVTGGGKAVNNSSIVPINFKPLTTGVSGSTGGGQFSVQRILPFKFDAFLRAVEEDITANVVSAPKVMTLNQQEATIVVGTKFPIITTTTTTGTTSTTTVDLKYYQDIGVRMNVIPQVSDNRYINMIMHPSVTSQTGSVTVFNSGGFQIASYPILTTREAETQVLMKDGETIVIGGLIQDKKTDSSVGIPFLRAIPFVGPAFSRTTTSTNKIDLLIFITSYLVRRGQGQRDDDVAETYRGAPNVTTEVAVATSGTEKAEVPATTTTTQ